MNNFFYLVITTIVSFSASAQQNFIQLSVSETIQVKAIEFIYEVSIGNSDRYDLMMDEMYDEDYDEYSEEEVKKKEPKPTIKEITAKLTKAKFAYTISDEKAFIVSSHDVEPSILVTVTSVEELKRLRDLLKEIDGVSGKIAETKFEEVETYYAEAYPRLMAQAKKRADLMASTSGKKAGGVIQVSEGRLSNTSTGDVWSDYLTNIMEMSSIMEGRKFSATRSEVMALTYRFELID